MTGLGRAIEKLERGEDSTREPLVVARRWDQLGGRLNAIVNAASLAEALGFEFRFVWPRGADLAINDPRRLFSDGYLRAFEIADTELIDLTPIPDWEIVGMEGSGARAALERAGAGAFVEVSEIFAISRLSDETCAAGRARFRRCFEGIGWNAEVLELISVCSGLAGVEGLSAVHVRAGDIVSGDWRHFIAHEKYTPTPYVEYAIEHLAEGGRRPVLVLSDNDRYLGWLKARFTTLITAAEIVPGYASLTEAQRAFADILILSRCEKIVGPPSSAFSRLAANLGCGQVTRADELLPAGTELELLRRGIAKRRDDAATDGFWGGLAARDICWCLDVFADELPSAEQFQLAAAAVDLEPDFAGGLARLARTAILVGDWQTGIDAAARALRVAEPVTRHQDPLLEALATEISVKCLAAGQGRVPPHTITDARRMRWSWRFARIAAARRRRLKDLEADVKQTLLRSERVTPYQMDAEAVATNLQRLITALEQISEADGLTLARTARVLDLQIEDPNLHPPRPAGLQQHRAAGSLDPVARDLARMATILEGALQRAIEAAAP